MKILILQDDFPPKSYGGAGIIAFNLAKAFKENGHSILVITIVENPEEEGEIEHEGMRVFRIYSKYPEHWRAYLSLYNPQTVKKVKQIIRDFKPNIIHAHNLHHYLSYYCLKLAKQSGAKVLLTAHDAMLFHYGKLGAGIGKVLSWTQVKKYKKRYNPFRNLIIKHYLVYVDRIFAVSGALKEALNQNGILNVEIIHNGIDVNEWQVTHLALDNFKKKYNLHGKKIIMFGGRLSEAKGGGQAVEAMVEVVKKVPGAVLLVIGRKNEYSQTMLRLAKERRIEANLFFTGWLAGEELRSAYRASDLVLVLSTYLDPFPTINLEAMANAKPVIGTCFGGTPEAVINGQTGYIIDPFNIILLARKIIELLINSDKAREFGEAGLEKVKKEFSLGKSVKKYLDAFAKM